MAELRDKTDITVEELEESLGAKKLPEFITRCEQTFLDRIDLIVEEICSDPNKKAIFVSGPTSSGKTTFPQALLLTEDRLTSYLSTITTIRTSLSSTKTEGPTSRLSMHWTSTLRHST